MPVKKKKRKAQSRRLLIDEWELHYLMTGEDWTFTIDMDSHIKPIWDLHKDYILSCYTHHNAKGQKLVGLEHQHLVKQHTRPYGWWRFEAKEPFINNESTHTYVRRLNNDSQNNKLYAFQTKETPTNQ